MPCSNLLCGVWFCRLDLDAWINEPPSESESEDEKPKTLFAKEEPKHTRPRHTEVDEKELARVCIPVLSSDLVIILPDKAERYTSDVLFIFSFDSFCDVNEDQSLTMTKFMDFKMFPCVRLLAKAL